MLLATMISFGAVWIWVAAAPMAFLDPEYPSWLAKQALLAACDLGDVVVLGDSRAAVGIVPALLPVKATNLAVGGGEAIEAYAALTRALRCPDRPKLVVLSFDAAHFMKPDLFWERTVRFGFLDHAELVHLREVSQTLGDFSVYEERHTDGIPSWLRDRLYTLRFPPFYFGSLVKGGIVLRWARNNRTLDSGIAARGQYYFGTADGSSIVAAEGKLRNFEPLPVLNHYFDRILALLSEQKIPVMFLSMPLNDATDRAMRTELRNGFAAWLARYETRYPGFYVAGPTIRAWPDRWFGDGFSHLNPEGAARFSAMLGPCLSEEAATCDFGPRQLAYRLQAAPPRTQNDAQ